MPLYGDALSAILGSELSQNSLHLADRPMWKLGEYLAHWLEDIARPATRPTTYAKYETITRLYKRIGTVPA